MPRHTLLGVRWVALISAIAETSGRAPPRDRRSRRPYGPAGGDHGEIRTAVRLQRCHRGIAPRRSLSSPSSHLSCRSTAVPPPRSVLPRGRPPVHEPGVTEIRGRTHHARNARIASTITTIAVYRSARSRLTGGQVVRAMIRLVAAHHHLFAVAVFPSLTGAPSLRDSRVQQAEAPG
jgi:hypothetical protein